MKRWLVCALVLAACSDGVGSKSDDDDDDGNASPEGGASASSNDASASTSGAGGDPSGPATTTGSGSAGACTPGAKDGPPSGATGELTPGGLDYDVRTPPGYDPTAAHPLVVVYSPYGVSFPAQTEGFTGLTGPAGARGWLVAYANHVSPADQAGIVEAARVIEGVAARWCIDPARVYLTGHSDGGSIATLIAVNQIGDPNPAAIAPSAAGASQSSLSSVACPPLTPAMVIHSANDGLFPPPDFGSGHAAWWAGCNGCGESQSDLGNGCASFDGCAAETRYCEHSGAHSSWPPQEEAMLDFFAGHAATGR